MAQLARIQNNIVSQSPVDDANLTPAALQEFVEDVIGTKVKPGTNVTVSYNDTTGETTISATGGGGGGASALNDLTDVTISAPANGQVLKYNGSQWINDTDGTGGGSGYYNLITNITELNDAITASSPTSGLEYTVAAATYNFTSNTTIPAGMKLKLDKGAKLTADTGVTLTINGRIEADPYYEIFGGAGTIELNAGSMDYISVMHFGAKGDGVTDDTVAFNKAIDAAVYIQKVRIPGVKDSYVISSTVQVGRDVPGCTECFSNYQVFGDAAGEGVAYGDVASTIKYIGTSGPCFNLADGRFQTKIKDLTIMGYNTAPRYRGGQNQRSSINAWNWENWVGYVNETTGVPTDNTINNALIASSTNANSDFEFDHHCAIAVDWGDAGDRSAGPRWGAQIFIEGIRIVDFVIGISISPNQGYQADTIWVKDCKFNFCTYGIAVGQDQCRSITFENIWMDTLFCAYTNNKTGRGNGSAFNITGGQYTTIFKLFEMTSAYRGQMHVSGLFSEACGFMGHLYGLGVNVNSAVFSGCEFGFDNAGYLAQNGQGHYAVPFSTFTVGTNVSFIGCNFHSNSIDDSLYNQGYVFKVFVLDSNSDISSTIVSKLTAAYPAMTSTAVRIKRDTYRVVTNQSRTSDEITNAIEASFGPDVQKTVKMHSLDVFCFSGSHYNFQGCTFTQNYKVVAPFKTITISGGSSLFNDLSTGYQQSDDVNLEDHFSIPDSFRSYVAPSTKFVTVTKGSFPYRKIHNATFAVSDTFDLAETITYPITSDRIFTVSVSTTIAEKVFIGDHLMYVVGNTPNSGTDQSNGGAAIPCLEVIGKTSNSLTIRKLCPEANIDGRTEYAYIYNGWNQFVSPTNITATGNGTNVTVSNLSLLKEGDIVRDSQNGNIVRVLSIGASTATFSGTVQNNSLLQSVIL